MALNPQQMAQFQALLAQAAATPAPHLSFKAGLLELKGKTVTADKRRGTVKLVTQDGLPHLQWCTRPGDSVELDLMLFKGAAVWERVDECKDGRVYLLRFKDSSARSFFWMQEAATDKDDDVARKVNELIANPPDDSASAANILGAGAGAGASEPTVRGPALSPPVATQQPTPPPQPQPTAPSTAATAQQNSLQRMIQAALVSARGQPAAPASADSSASSSSSAAPAFDAATLARSLNDLASQYRQQREPALPAHSLTDILSVDRVLPVLNDADVLRLSAFLPGGANTAADLSTHMRSAQFAQTVQRMNGVCNGENYGSLLSSLGLEIGNGGFGVEGLVAAIERQVQREKNAAPPTPTQPK